MKQQILQAQEQPIDCLTFSGGGAKGTEYGGVHSALHDTGILVGVKAVSGASAGASTAAFIATGITPEDFKQACQINIEKVLDTPENKGLLNKDNKPIQDIIAATILKNVSNYINNIDDIGKLCQQRLDELDNDPLLAQWEIEEQKKKLYTIISNDYKEVEELQNRCKNKGKIFFKDLTLLRALNPAKFKNLVVNAVRKDNAEEMKLFNAEETPDVEIAQACAASSAIALAFKPVEIDGVKYIDGGHRDNIPLNYFKKHVKDDNDKAEEITENPAKTTTITRKRNRTIAMAFGASENSSAHVAIYSAKENITNRSKLMTFLIDVVYKMVAKIGGKFKYTKEKEKTYQNIRKNALNTVILKPKGISTLSFKKANEQADYLYAKGYLQTINHLDNHGIVKDNEPNLAQKQFLLQVYEEIQSDSILSRWKDKIITGRQEKSANLLSFVMSNKWQDQGVNNTLKEFIFKAALNRSNNKLDNNTNTMQTIIKLLNDPKTSEIVRLNFVELLGIDVDERLNQDKDFTKFKFKKEDFNQLLQEKKIIKTSTSRHRSINY